MKDNGNRKNHRNRRLWRRDRTRHHEPDHWEFFKGAACVSAAMFALSAGYRAYNINEEGKVKDDECKSVQKLASAALPLETEAAAPRVLEEVRASMVQQAEVQEASPVPAGARGAVMLLQTLSSNRKMDCVQSQGLSGCIPPTQSAATDMGALINTGLDKQVAPLAKKLISSGWTAR